MTDLGFERPLYILAFDHRGSFQSGLFGWKGALSKEQTARVAASEAIIYDGLAVGRTTFWDALVGWRDGRTTREAASAEVARRYTRCAEAR